MREYLKSLDFFILQHRLDASSQPLFTAITAQGGFMLSRVGVNSMAKMASRIAEKLGLENTSSYTGHCFRGSAATNMAENGASDQQMKSLCRWKSEKMADTYTRKTERLKNEGRKKTIVSIVPVLPFLNNQRLIHLPCGEWMSSFSLSFDIILGRFVSWDP